jgi:hypothetical protein
MGMYVKIKSATDLDTLQHAGLVGDGLGVLKAPEGSVEQLVVLAQLGKCQLTLPHPTEVSTQLVLLTCLLQQVTNLHNTHNTRVENTV